MSDAARISRLVERYLDGGVALTDYLVTLTPDLRDEVRRQCEEAEFIAEFFEALPPPPTIRPRPEVIGGCRLVELLDHGAMGEVHRAIQIELEREVAVKLIRSDLQHRDEFLARFQREALVLAGLDHPGIVKILAFGQEEGWRYFVMELVRGCSLRELLPELWGNGEIEGDRFDRIARILAEVLEVLAYAHGRGVVHRDLKPSNVMLDAAGHPRLVDFGLAKDAATDRDDAKLQTLPGVLLGTPAYLCPEVARREPHPRHAPDLWAAGVMLFQLLTARLPYDRPSTDELLEELTQPRWLDPRAIDPRVPKPLAAICRRALAPDPTLRYPSAQQLAADLRRFLAREPILAERGFAWDRLRAHARRHRRLYAGIGAALVLGVAAGIVTLRIASQRRAAAAVQALQDATAPATASVVELTAVATSARQLLRDGELAGDGAQQVQRTLQRVEDEIRRRHQAARRQIVLGAGSPVHTPLEEYRAPSLPLQFAGMQVAAATAAALPGLEPPLSIAESTFPEVRIGDPRGGSGQPVRIDALDPVTGQPSLTVSTGTTPCAARLAPGHYRIVVGDAAAFAECTRTLGAPGAYRIEPRLVPTDNAHDDMVLVAAGVAKIGQDDEGASIYRSRQLTHPAFWIDRHEVTCRAYHEFCMATGTAPPRPWGDRYEQAWDELPVVGVSAADAARYAEWVGKRLPTWAEWQIAARGPTGSLFPWGDDPAPAMVLATVGGDATLSWDHGVRPVGTTPLDTSWCGAQDMLGNIDEWTETPYVAPFDGVPFPVYPWRLRGGSCWSSPRDRYLALSAVSPGQPQWRQSGFRCAKSAEP